MKTNVINQPGETRRDFIKQTAATMAIVAGSSALSVFAQSENASLSIVLEADNPLSKQPPVTWAVEQLRAALKARGIATQLYDALAQAPSTQECILVTGRTSVIGTQLLTTAGLNLLVVPEALALANGVIDGRKILLACGADARGLMYAVLDLADRVNYSGDAMLALRNVGKLTERPANAIRSIARFFVSDVEDKPWFNDRAFWQEYLSMLAAQRFNRFSLTFGIAYDFTTEIRDCYFHFAYPFLLQVPGYNVRAVGLPDAERDSNLEMLRYISEEATRRGLHFQLGLWTHAYQWTNSPFANYTIEGLTAATHGPYCREAVRALLIACPAIQGVTLRIHGESGVAEGSYDFWKQVFDGVAQCGRRVEIDLHAKGIDQSMIDGALATNLPLNISPKFWAEHLGLPYMQTSIRPQETPPTDAKDNGFFAKSFGSRKFLRYGYGDLLTENRKFGVLHRVWPGTQRLLLWGDPVTAASYGRDFNFCGSLGVEWCEPLSFKGRKGSGLPGGRDAYSQESLRSPGGGWQKYLYTYRLWGRLAYNPAADPDTWRRFLRHQFNTAAGPAEAALAHASRILPLITTAHCPSAANNNYWPEIYSNMAIADDQKPSSYNGDTLSPKRFGTVSPLDPELFSRMDDFAAELLSGKRTGKYSPLEVADWLDALAAVARERLQEAKTKMGAAKSPEFQRLSVDVAIQCGLGSFFAHKFRAGIFYALYDQSGYHPALQEAVTAYHAARKAWVEAAEPAMGIYALDITFGFDRHLRGNWADRLPAIDEDIADLEQRLKAATNNSNVEKKIDPQRVEEAMRIVHSPSPRRSATVEHMPQKTFVRGEKITIEAKIPVEPDATTLARLHYRQVNQAQIWRVTDMTAGENNKWAATIPADYSDSPFPMQYYFELQRTSGAICLSPGFDLNRANQPYHVLRQEKKS